MTKAYRLLNLIGEEKIGVYLRKIPAVGSKREFWSLVTKDGKHVVKGKTREQMLKILKNINSKDYSEILKLIDHIEDNGKDIPKLPIFVDKNRLKNFK